MEFAGYDATLNRTRLDALKRGAAEYLLEPEGPQVVEEWYGWRPMTYDDLPILGRAARVQNLVLATGHGMLGVTMSAATGLLIADLLCDRPAEFDLTPFSPIRFNLRKPTMSLRNLVAFVALSTLPLALWADAPAPAETADKSGPVDFQWGVKIPLRDGVKLNATVYRPQGQKEPVPCIFTLTPYISQSYHDRGMYFAGHGYVYLTVDVRGRGNSEGEFTPMLQEARDGHDVVEWLAQQSYCNGKVTMWGGSYAAVNGPQPGSHLATIVPVAAPYAGVDFPRRNNIAYPYDAQWLTFTSGKAGQEKIFSDSAFWAAKFKELYVSHRAFKDVDSIIGNPSPVFQNWIAHPMLDAYWDSYNPSAEQYAKIDMPILSISGQYDGDQPGAMTTIADRWRTLPNTQGAALPDHRALGSRRNADA
jgi:pimeloyl-ACP methyl ester carboxylesterase